MPTVESLLLAITYFTLGINAFVLVHCLVKTSLHKKYLALFFFASLVNYLDDVFWRTDGWQWFPTLTNVYIPFAFIMPIAFYLYIQALIKPEKRVKLFNTHWVGFIFALVCCSPYYLLDSVTKLARLSSAPGSLSSMGLITWGPSIALLVFIPFGLIYIFLCLRLLKDNQIRIKSFFSNIEDKSLSWVRWVILILMLAWLLASIELILPSQISENSYWSIIIAVFELSWIWVFAHFAMQQNELLIPLDELENNHEKLNDLITNEDTEKEPIPQKKYQRSPLSDNEVNEIKTALSSSIDQQLHRQAELSLHNLAEHLNIPVIKISQVLNVHMKTGFYDYINKNRIVDACEQLKSSSLNIIDIAYLVGFNSKSTFNSAFKKHTQMTPSQFKKTG